jgi:hydroxymethylpyrimidine/phosphomethylpyrimidine kinase
MPSTDAVVEQARSILEDVTIAGWKVGFLGSAETVSAVAEVLSDYPDVPLVSYLPACRGSTKTSCSPTSTRFAS